MSRVGGAVAVAVVVMMFATGCSATSFDEVSGTVLDGRTGQPIARAKVTAAAPGTPTIAASSDPAGKFTLQEVSRKARLQVTATNYKPADVAAAEGALSIRLQPIPIQGVVTSTLTNRALAATLGGKLPAGGGLRLRTKADGSFRAYGVGPGDRLRVTAPGYKAASLVINADRKLKIRLVAEEATRIEQVNQWLRTGSLAPVWRYVFLPPNGGGYGYEIVPAEFRKDFAAAFPQEGSKGFELRSVTKDGIATDMLAIAIALDPKVAALPGSDESFLAGVVQGSGAGPELVTLAGGQQVPYMAPAGGPEAIVVSEGALHVLFLGEDAQQLKSIASTFIKAHE
jgi:Carboxypeptidase regulatory-like domain